MDEAAHAAAEKFGLERRAPNDTGTSIAIIDCELSIDELGEAVERYWWPRILDERLFVELVASDGKVSTPRPKKRADLAPFIRAYGMIRDGDDGASDEKLKTFRKHKGIELGKLALVRATEENPLKNSVALIRHLKMVVSYEGYGSSAEESAAGVFLADDEANEILTYSEPGNHNKWDPHSDRLQRFENGKEIVESIHRRINGDILQFQRNLAPPAGQEKSTASQLNRMLSGLFKTPGAKPPRPPEGPSRPISLGVKEERESLGAGRYQDTATITIANDGAEELLCTLKVSHQILGDTHLRKVDETEVTLKDDTGSKLADGIPCSYDLTLPGNGKLKLSAIAVLADKAFSRFTVEVIGRG